MEPRTFEEVVLRAGYRGWKDLERRGGVNRITLWRVVRRGQRPSPAFLERLATVLELSPDALAAMLADQRLAPEPKLRGRHAPKRRGRRAVTLAHLAAIDRELEGKS